jgi:hypothetical protein
MDPQNFCMEINLTFLFNSAGEKLRTFLFDAFHFESLITFQAYRV